MNHYRSLGVAPYYDRRVDPHMKHYFRARAGPSIIKLSGDSTTGHLAQDEFKRAVRYASNGIWKNQTPKRDMGRHPKFAAKSCTDCDSGVYCRCPVHTSIVDQYSNAASPYSREKQPPSPTQQNFLAVTQRIFSAPNSPSVLESPGVLMSPPPTSAGLRANSPPLSTAIMYAGHAAAQRHSQREPMCGGGLVTSLTKRSKRRAMTAEPGGRGLQLPSEFKRCI